MLSFHERPAPVAVAGDSPGAKSIKMENWDTLPKLITRNREQEMALAVQMAHDELAQRPD